MIRYMVVSNDDKHTVTAILEGLGQTITFTSDDEDYKDMMRAILDNDEDTLMEYYNKLQTQMKKLEDITERLAFDGENLYLDHDIIDNRLTKTVTRLIKTYPVNFRNEPIVKFLINLADNPSGNSKESLYDFLLDKNLLINKDGYIYAYKGVEDDKRSCHSGEAYVDGKYYDDYIPNEVGSVITMPRSKVEDNRDVGCSTGLHAGSKEYAQSYGTKLALVLINPRDVVSVPAESGFEKLRCCRYEVLAYVDKSTSVEEDKKNYEEK